MHFVRELDHAAKTLEHMWRLFRGASAVRRASLSLTCPNATWMPGARVATRLPVSCSEIFDPRRMEAAVNSCSVYQA